MATWTDDELTIIGNAEELEIASLRLDGTLRKPVTIWVVRINDDLYVRSANGRDSGWYQGTQLRREGRIWAGGIKKNVRFLEVDADDDINDQIDAAYLSKYERYPQYVAPMVVPKARSATLRLVPYSGDRY